MPHKPRAAAKGLAVMAACLCMGIPARAAWADAQAPQADLRQQLIDLDNQLDDQESDIRGLAAKLEDVRQIAAVKPGEALPEESEAEENDGDMPFDVAGPGYDQAEETPMQWRRLSLLVNIDAEFTSEFNTDPASKKGIDLGNGDSPDFIQAPKGSPNGDVGMFFKHLDVHFKYKFSETMFMKLDYNFSALELDDVGVGWKRLPLLPFVGSADDYTFSVFAGQKRQSFGIEQQTDSRYTLFPNRALMYGGHNPFGHVATPSADPFDLFDQTNTISTGLPVANEDDANDAMIAELVYEKVMGLHFYHAHDLGFMAYTAAFDIVNDESEDSQDGQPTDTLGLAFPLQTQDQDVSEIGRLSFEPRIANNCLPFGAQFNFGASAFHDPENTAFHASQPQNEEWADAQGLDATLQTSRDVLYLQSEYVKKDQYGPSFNTATLLPNNVYGGLQGRAESYYVAGAFQPWRIFDPEAPRVELLARYENYYYDDVSDWLRLALGPYTGSFNAVTVALKYTYEGNCHTSINYTSYGLNNNFGSTGPTSFLQIEQQVTF
ncbi:MAG TPA: porin [bacterium]|jgi:hypothetical protein|nr:porin [bacterium]